jgi:hypothetical protein
MQGIAKPRSAILYGISGSGKTSELARIAKWIYKTYGLRSRLISASSGGIAAFEDAGLVDPDNPCCSKEAIVQYFDISYRQWALANVRQLSEGYFPRLAKMNGKVDLFLETDTRCMTTPEEWETIGAYLVEGTKDISDVWLNHIRNSPNKIGPKQPATYQEGGYEVKGLDVGHYGIVQLELDKVIRQGFHRLPIKWDIWTGMVDFGEDSENRKIYGPAAAGKAITLQIPGWFGDCFHLQQIKVLEGEQLVQKHVAWFIEHTDSTTGAIYLSKTRILPELVPSLLKLFPHGYIELGYTKGIEQYFEALDLIRKNYLEYLKQKGGENNNAI